MSRWAFLLKSQPAHWLVTEFVSCSLRCSSSYFVRLGLHLKVLQVVCFADVLVGDSEAYQAIDD